MQPTQHTYETYGTVYPRWARVPAGLPGRAKSAAQTVPNPTPHHGTGEARPGTQQPVRSGQQAAGKPTGEPFP
jgi:hypothetical protein